MSEDRDKADIELRVRVQKELVKNALKEGISEWLDEQIQEVGKWTLRAFAAVLVAGLAYFVLMLNGWRGPK